MLSKTFTITKEIPESVEKRIIHDSSFKVAIPMLWVQALNIKKGTLVRLDFNDDGFSVHILPKLTAPEILVND